MAAPAPLARDRDRDQLARAVLAARSELRDLKLPKALDVSPGKRAAAALEAALERATGLPELRPIAAQFARRARATRAHSKLLQRAAAKQAPAILRQKKANLVAVRRLLASTAASTQGIYLCEWQASPMSPEISAQHDGNVLRAAAAVTEGSWHDGWPDKLDERTYFWVFWFDPPASGVIGHVSVWADFLGHLSAHATDHFYSNSWARASVAITISAWQRPGGELVHYGETNETVAEVYAPSGARVLPVNSSMFHVGPDVLLTPGYSTAVMVEAHLRAEGGGADFSASSMFTGGQVGPIHWGSSAYRINVPVVAMRVEA